LVVAAGVPVCAKKLTEMVPLALTEDGLKFACTPDGRPLALTATLPVSPPTNAMVIVLFTLVPGGTVTAVGEATIVKLGSAVTFRTNVVVEVLVLLVPVMVTVAAPTVAVLEAVKVSVLPADPLTVAGLKLAVTPDGRPLTLNVTALLEPTSFTVTLVGALVPCSTLTPEAAMKIPFPGGIAGNAFCTSMVNSSIQKVPAFGELARASVGMLLASALS